MKMPADHQATNQAWPIHFGIMRHLVSIMDNWKIGTATGIYCEEDLYHKFHHNHFNLWLATTDGELRAWFTLVGPVIDMYRYEFAVELADPLSIDKMINCIIRILAEYGEQYNTKIFKDTCEHHVIAAKLDAKIPGSIKHTEAGTHRLSITL